MANVKLAIIYYSATGTNYQLAQWAAEGGRAAGADVAIYKVQELMPPNVVEGNPAMKAHAEATKDVPVATPDVIAQSDAIIFSSPTRFGGMASQMKQFIDTCGGIWFNGQTVNKVVSAMTSAQNDHGGQEATVLSLYTSMCHWGAIIVPPGYTDPILFAAGGNPYGGSVSVDEKNEIRGDANSIRQAAAHQAKRVVTVAQWVKQGLQG